MKKVFLLTLIFFTVACSSSSSLDEAYAIHLKMRDKQKKVWMNIAQLDAMSDDTASIKSIKLDYLTWRDHIVEVPGYPHVHMEGEEHRAQPEYTEEQMLEIQKTLFDELARIEKRIEELKMK